MKDAAVASYIDSHFDRFVEELSAFCRIPSVSVDGAGLLECAEFLKSHFANVGLDAEIMLMGGPDNPPLVYVAADSARSPRTLLIYGHFDVQPAGDPALWTTPAFSPTIRDGYLYGRGTSDAKAQVFAHLKAIEALRATGGELPIGLRILLDPQEEIGTPMMECFIRARPELVRADFGLSADGEAFAGDVTTLTYGNRGNCFLTISVRTAEQDAHSGVFGGVMPNAAWRILDFLRTVRGADGAVKIEGFYDRIEPPSQADLAALAALPVDAAAFARQMGVPAELAAPDADFWRKIMFSPTCNIAGLSSGYDGPGTKTIIPAAATVKLEMRLVKGQDPDDIYEKVRAHATRHGFRDLLFERGMFYKPSRTSVDHPMTAVVAEAVRANFGHQPLIVPVSGGSSPRHVFSDIAGVPLVEVAYAQFEARAHAPNESMSLDRFRKGVAVSASIMSGLSAL